MEFWRKLSERERMLLLAAAAMVGIFLFFQGLVSPIMNWRAEQERAFERAEGLYELVKEAASRASGAAASGDAETPIRNAITQSASRAGVSLVYVSARPSGEVDTTASQADPADLFAWLQGLEQDYGVRVVIADIAREQSQGSLVRAQLTLARRGGP
jgi:type II secretory pathway component PulM